MGKQVKRSGCKPSFTRVAACAPSRKPCTRLPRTPRAKRALQMLPPSKFRSKPDTMVFSFGAALSLRSFAAFLRGGSPSSNARLRILLCKPQGAGLPLVARRPCEVSPRLLMAWKKKGAYELQCSVGMLLPPPRLLGSGLRLPPSGGTRESFVDMRTLALRCDALWVLG